MNNATKEARIVMIAPGLIDPSPLNPRKRVDEAAHAELMESFRSNGFDPALSHLLVRPLGNRHELVCGHRRWAAATELGIECPCVVREIPDAEVAELQLVENIQRESLSPMEEASGVVRLLEQAGSEGLPVHSLRSLAERLGKSTSFVSRCVVLSRLQGTETGDAVESGALSVAHAEIIASMPTPELRAVVAKAALHGRYGEGQPMSRGELREWVAGKFTTRLLSRDFDFDDAELVPVETDNAGQRLAGGPCSDCPHRTQHKTPMCLNIDCHGRKRRAAYDRWGAAQADGTEVIPFGQVAGLLDHTGKRLGFNSGLVEMDERPAEHLLREGVRNPPPWNKIVAGQGVPVKVFKDDEGGVHRVIDKALALAAARANGHKIFAGEEIEDAVEEVERQQRREAFVAEMRADPANADLSAEDAAGEFDRREREKSREAAEKAREKQRAEFDEKRAGDAAVKRAILLAARAVKKPTREHWQLILQPMADEAMQILTAFDVAVALGLPADPEKDDAKAIEEAVLEHLAEMPEPHFLAAALVLAGEINPPRWDNVEQWQKTACKVLGVDAKAIRKEAGRRKPEPVKEENTIAAEAQARWAKQGKKKGGAK